MTDTSAATPSSAPPEVVRSFVARTIHDLQGGVLANRSEKVAALARLRRAVGKPPGSVFEVLPYTTGADLAPGNAPDEPTAAETAAHLAMTLYAVHQQGQAMPMHRTGPKYGLGRAVRRLVPDAEVPERHPVLRRFQALGTSTTLDELAHHARGLVQQLRGQSLPLDYGLLAGQFWRWQRPGGPQRVRLVWGRDFHLRTDDGRATSPDETAGDDPSTTSEER